MEGCNLGMDFIGPGHGAQVQKREPYGLSLGHDCLEALVMIVGG